MEKADKIGLGLAYLGVLIITLICMASAETIYAGDTIEIPLDFEIVNCSATNSTYNLEGLNLSWHDKNIVISTSPYYKSDNLTISCWVIKYGEVVEEHHRGGGGSCKYKEDFDWNCSEFGECIEGNQTRICKEKNNCGNTYGKPIEIRNCTIIQQNDTEIIEIEPIEEPKIKWYIRLWNWIKKLFK